MSFTKVAPAGIGTEPGTSILIGDSLLHSTGIDIGSNTGIGVTIRKHGDATFTGIVTAASFSASGAISASSFTGDGSGLEGVSSSGIGTALNDDDTNILNKIYYVNQELSIGSTVTVNHPDTGTASYTHYQDLVVKNDADFIVADGDTFIPDILGITTSTLAASAATGGRIRAGTITNAGANGAPNFPNGLTGTAGTFTGNLNVGGVLTYEDVTNIDSVGVITARDGLRVTGIATISGDVSIADKIVHTGDTNTAIRFPAADIITAETGGSERLRITSDGNMGLGLTPAYSGIFGGAQRTFQIGGTAAPCLRITSSTSNQADLVIHAGNSGRRADIANMTENGSISMWTKPTGGSITERFNISADGYVTKPNHPSFLAGRTGGNQTFTVGTYPLNVARINVGNHYNTSTYKFVAPVAGVYYFYGQVYYNNGAGQYRLHIRKTPNGGSAFQLNTSSHKIDAGHPSGGNDTSDSLSIIESMAVGDSVELYSDQNHSIQCYYNINDATYGAHTYFMGYLIG